MRVLAHIHTFNDADIIDRTIGAVLRQTRRADAILIVDNASSDCTLDRPSLKNATVLRHQQNLGTSGAVATGLRFAVEHDYDWVWVFDADSLPAPDALERLLDLYTGWPEDRQQETGFVACLPRNQRDGKPYHGGVFTPEGIALVEPAPEQRQYPCHITIWSGCLYRLAAVRRIGLPNADYVLDWGEFEYGWRLMQLGYKGCIDQNAVLHHNIRGSPSLNPIDLRLGWSTATFYEFPPIRCYYTCRNILYFALYEVAQRRPGLVFRAVLRVGKLTVNFLLRPRHHAGQILACFRGAWHGVTGNIVARY